VAAHRLKTVSSKEHATPHPLSSDSSYTMKFKTIQITYWLGALALLSPLPQVTGTPLSEDSHYEAECIEQINERTAAINVRDWRQLERIAMRFVQSCNGVLPSKEIATAYADAAGANKEMGRFKEALNHANAGIDLNYLVTANHLERMEALFALSQIQEAKDSFRVAEYLIQLAMERNVTELQRVQSDLEKRLVLSEKSLYESQLRFLNKYRPQLGTK